MNCVGCGGRFDQTNPRRRYCSPACKARSNHLMRAFGITQHEREQLLEVCRSMCMLCRIRLDTLAAKNVHIDHDHGTGRIRGVLCQVCNHRLGWWEKNRDRIEAYVR